jgi:uncharacterized protein involved in exopolysaccharide biosynthesis
MAFSSDRTISIQQLATAVKRHKMAGLLTFLVVMVAVVAAWQCLPRKYGSEGRMVVRLGRANLDMNATADSARMVSIQDTRETGIRSVMDLVNSQAVLGRVVDSVGPRQILENTIELPLPQRPVAEGAGAAGLSDKEYRQHRLREKAIKRLASELQVTSEKNSANIEIFCTGATPRLAQQIVDEVMKNVQQTHVQVHAVNRSRSHFDRELAAREAELTRCQAALEEFATKHGFLSVDDARTTLNRVIDKLENDLVDTSVNLRQSQAMVAEMKRQASAIEVEFEMPRTGMEKQVTAEAQQQLYQRIAEKARLLASYNESHPKIVQINSEIERLRQEVGEMPEERVEQATVHPVYEQLKVALVKESAMVQALQERLGQIHQKLAEKRERLAGLNALKTESMGLQRQIDVAQIAFDNYARKSNEARMADELDKEEISDIVIQQPATLVLRKVSPRGSVMLPVGFLFATACGLLVAIFADRKNLLALSTPEEIEEALDIPVLASIPRVRASRVQTS